MFGLPDFTNFTDEQLREALNDFIFNRDVAQAFIDRAVEEQKRRKREQRVPRVTEEVKPLAPKRKMH